MFFSTTFCVVVISGTVVVVEVDVVRSVMIFSSKGLVDVGISGSGK